jgi:hypothetical protein
MHSDYLPARIALVLNGVSMMILYPLNMLVLERASWIWDYPDRNMAMEHMLVAVYVTMGPFLVCAAPHLAFRSDVVGTYLAPITLALTHPRHFYLFQWNRA